jgi:hypothetical protein
MDFPRIFTQMLDLGNLNFQALLRDNDQLFHQSLQQLTYCRSQGGTISTGVSTQALQSENQTILHRQIKVLRIQLVH